MNFSPGSKTEHLRGLPAYQDTSLLPFVLLLSFIAYFQWKGSEASSPVQWSSPMVIDTPEHNKYSGKKNTVYMWSVLYEINVVQTVLGDVALHGSRDTLNPSLSVLIVSMRCTSNATKLVRY